MIRSLPKVTAVVAATLCAGCIAHAGHAFDPGVTHVEKPGIQDTGARKPAPPPAGTDVAEAAQPSTAPPPRTPLPTIEGRDPGLAASLRAVAVDASGTNLRTVAAEYQRVGVFDAAFDYYQRALNIDRTDAAAYEGLARTWRQSGFPALAMGDASRAVYFAPSSAAAYNTLGTVIQAAGNRREARRAYEQALQYEPGAPYALTNLCYLSFLEGNLDEATRECRGALAADPKMIAAHNNLALIFAAQGRLDLARAELSVLGDAAAVDFNMGMIYMARKDYAEAEAEFRAAGAARPLFTAAADRARQARKLTSQYSTNDTGTGEQHDRH